MLRRHPGNPSPRSGFVPAQRAGCAPAAPAVQPPARRIRPAFTLVEILVVIGIVVVLVALLVPVLGSARSSAQNVACLSNLHQMMMAFHLYAGNNRECLPDPAAAEQSWESLLKPYLPSRESYRCPSDQALFDALRSSYDWRDTPDPDTTLAGKRFTEINRNDVVFVFDALPDWHRKGKINVAKVDGSTETMLHQDCLKDLDRSIYDSR